jgi:3-methyladenine DNA glycosylase AlkD
VLAIWDVLWRTSPYGDVLFAAIEAYAPQLRKGQVEGLWPVLRHWSARVDNWCHADALSGLYSYLLAAQPDAVLPQLRGWNASEALWPRRISLVSLIHYSGKNAVFLRPAQMLPLLATCVGDRRKHVELALGWVLRELARVHADEAAAFLDEHAPRMSARALARARAAAQRRC